MKVAIPNSELDKLGPLLDRASSGDLNSRLAVRSWLIRNVGTYGDEEFQKRALGTIASQLRPGISVEQVWTDLKVDIGSPPPLFTPITALGQAAARVQSQTSTAPAARQPVNLLDIFNLPTKTYLTITKAPRQDAIELARMDTEAGKRITTPIAALGGASLGLGLAALAGPVGVGVAAVAATGGAAVSAIAHQYIYPLAAKISRSEPKSFIDSVKQFASNFYIATTTDPLVAAGAVGGLMRGAAATLIGKSAKAIDFADALAPARAETIVKELSSNKVALALSKGSRVAEAAVAGALGGVPGAAIAGATVGLNVLLARTIERISRMQGHNIAAAYFAKDGTVQQPIEVSTLVKPSSPALEIMHGSPRYGAGAVAKGAAVAGQYELAIVDTLKSRLGKWERSIDSIGKYTNMPKDTIYRYVGRLAMLESDGLNAENELPRIAKAIGISDPVGLEALRNTAKQIANDMRVVTASAGYQLSHFDEFMKWMDEEVPRIMQEYGIKYRNEYAQFFKKLAETASLSRKENPMTAAQRLMDYVDNIDNTQNIKELKSDIAKTIEEIRKARFGEADQADELGDFYQGLRKSWEEYAKSKGLVVPVDPFEYLNGVVNGYARRVYHMFQPEFANAAKNRKVIPLGMEDDVVKKLGATPITETLSKVIKEEFDVDIADWLAATKASTGFFHINELASHVAKAKGGLSVIDNIRLGQRVTATVTNALRNDPVFNEIAQHLNNISQKQIDRFWNILNPETFVRDTPGEIPTYFRNTDPREVVLEYSMAVRQGLKTQTMVEDLTQSLTERGLIKEADVHPGANWVLVGEDKINVDGNIVTLPADKLGPLAGKYIPVQIARELAREFIRYNEQGLMVGMKRISNIVKSAWLNSPKTLINNIMANFALAHVYGVSPTDIIFNYPKAISELKLIGQRRGELVGVPLNFIGNYTLSREAEQMIKTLHSNLGKTPLDRLEQLVNAITQNRIVGFTRLFGEIEDATKTAVYFAAKRSGLSTETAAWIANNVTFDYSRVGTLPKAIRDTGILPFIGYPLFAIGRIAEAQFKNPLRLAGVERTFGAARESGYEPEDKSAVMAGIPEHVNNFIAVPMNNNRYMIVSMDNWHPFGAFDDMAGFFNNIGGMGVLGVVADALLAQGRGGIPPISSFYGQPPIFNPDKDSTAARVGKTVAFIGSGLFAPGFVRDLQRVASDKYTATVGLAMGRGYQYEPSTIEKMFPGIVPITTISEDELKNLEAIVNRPLVPSWTKRLAYVLAPNYIVSGVGSYNQIVSNAEVASRIQAGELKRIAGTPEEAFKERMRLTEKLILERSRGVAVSRLVDEKRNEPDIATEIWRGIRK